MSEIVLNAEIRTAVKKHAKAVRAEGNVPGVYYAHGEQNLTIQVPRPSLNPVIYTSETHIINLTLQDGTTKKCILRDVQFDPVTDRPIHFDLQGLREDEELTVEVPVALVGGTAAGIQEGGILQHIIHKLRISCLPRNIPEKIEVNVSGLGINDFVHVRDLNIPDVTVLENPDSPVAGVVPPTVHKEEEVVAEAPAEIQEPEVVGKGKKAEEEEGAEQAPAKGEAKQAPARGEGKQAPAKGEGKEEKK
jgi:large subunit ribosomal protein L25